MDEITELTPHCTYCYNTFGLYIRPFHKIPSRLISGKFTYLCEDHVVIYIQDGGDTSKLQLVDESENLQ